MTAPVPIGHMRLYSHMRPGMLAGTYRIDLNQDFGSTTRPVDQVTKFVEVTGPRFGLPGTEIHSVFPPHNSVGPFHNQLPHIALKRRTLPWERPGDPDAEERGERLPWLALVILSDGEANFVRNMSVKDVLPNRLHDGIADDAVCDAIEVTNLTVEKVFPGEEEFPYLLHVRQVNVNDTENAGNDEDGFMAVVMANRLPRRGQNYGAYLISVESRYQDLPGSGNATDDIGDASVYSLSAEQLVAHSYSGGSRAARMALSATEQPKRKATPGGGFAGAGVAGAASGAGLVATETRGNIWHAAASEPARAVSGDDQPAGVAAHSTMTVVNDMDLLAIEPTATLVRFPVLAHWQFTCTDGLDFRELMINLDVAMLGNPPAAGPGVDPPQVTDSGHVLIDNLTRGGERVSAWYRGPFTPRQVRRRLRNVPFHGADQARTIGGDFIENLGEAAAFEIGRMLALADPSFLQELLRWRRDGFRRLKTASLLDGSGLGDLVVDGVAVAGLGRLLARDLYVGIGAGGLGPQIDPLGGLRLGDEDAALIASGLGTPIARVRSALGIGTELTVPGSAVGSAPRPEITTFDGLIAAGDTELAHLRTELDQTVEGIVTDARPDDLRRGDG
jgi:hypothetical protein